MGWRDYQKTAVEHDNMVTPDTLAGRTDTSSAESEPSRGVLFQEADTETLPVRLLLPFSVMLDGRVQHLKTGDVVTLGAKQARYLSEIGWTELITPEGSQD